jgi:radical SAM protein with 4Fe4S-binding SPASM domain
MNLLPDLLNFKNQYGSGLLKGATTLGDNVLTYILPKKPWRGPLYVDWEVTYACNSRCEYCNCWQMAEPKRELNTKEALQVIKQLGEMGVWLLIFTGGEPLVRPDLHELIKEAKKQGMNVGINTNGSLLKKHAKMLVVREVDSITVTAESFKAEIHDNIRNFKGSFNYLLEGIEEIKKIRNNNKPKITVRMDFTKENYKDLKHYLNYWSNKVDGIIFQPIHQTTTTAKYISTQDLRFEKKDYKSFREYFDKFIMNDKRFSNLYYKEFPTFFFTPQSLYKRYRCFAGYVFGQIDPYGNVYSCTEYVHNAGNLRKKSFKNIWKGKNAETHRKIIREQKFTCKCWYYCTGPVNSYLSRILGMKSEK